jgi:hypothetical protein
MDAPLQLVAISLCSSSGRTGITRYSDVFRLQPSHPVPRRMNRSVATLAQGAHHQGFMHSRSCHQYQILPAVSSWLAGNLGYQTTGETEPKSDETSWDGSLWPARLGLPHRAHCATIRRSAKICSLHRPQTRSFIIMHAATPASSAMTATSSSRAPRTSGFECTTRAIPTIGSITRPYHFRPDSGLSQMRRLALITPTWPTALSKHVCAWHQQIHVSRPNQPFSNLMTGSHGCGDCTTEHTSA